MWAVALTLHASGVEQGWKTIMTTKPSKTSEVQGGAAPQKKADQNKDAAGKGGAKPSAPTKIPAGAGDNANTKKAR